MNTEMIKQKYIEALQEEIEEIDFSNIDSSESLSDNYGINSFYIVQMIITAEDTFDIFFEDDELITTNYGTLDDLINVIKQKIDEE